VVEYDSLRDALAAVDALLDGMPEDDERHPADSIRDRPASARAS
jgi:hypothetical protein